MKRYLAATMPYLGGKRAIAREILAVIDDVHPEPGTIADAFFGAGAVSIAAKALGWKVRANDMSPISEAAAQALVVNGTHRLSEEVVEQALTHEPGEIPGNRELSLPENCRDVLARMVGYERNLDGGPTRWLVRAWIAKTAISMATWGVPTMAAGRRTWDELTPGQAQQLKRTGKPLQFAMKLAQDLNRGVFDNAHRNTFNRGDAVAFVGSVEADICYLDPPYPATMSYEKTYVGVNRLLEPGASDTPSPWSDADGWKLLAGVFDAAEAIPSIVISMGKGADPERISEMLKERGREPSYRTLDLRHLQSLKTSSDPEGDELLIVGTR